MIEITEALDPAAVAACRTLFQQYQKALDIDLGLQGFATELDTLPAMADAQRLYERLRFRDIPAHRHNPIAGARFLGSTWDQAENGRRLCETSRRGRS